MNRKNLLFLYLASAFLPMLLFLAMLAVTGLVPFGDQSVLISDAWGQYLDFLSYWRTILAGENDLFYTFSKNMGGDMLNLAAYYLLSPFNLLFTLASDESMPLIYTIVVMVKMALCGTTFFHAAGKMMGLRWQNLIFSTGYALMSYNILYGWNIMWLDGVLVLPLIVLGLYHLAEGKAPWLYCFTLFYSLATNFYIGYMLCITAVMSFAALLFLRRCPVSAIPRQSLRFCAASLTGGLGSAAIWLPTFLSLAGERSQTNSAQFLLGRNFSIYGFLPKLLCGAANTKEMAGGTPHVFCGTLAMLLVLVFLLSHQVAPRKRIAGAVVLLVIFGNFYLKPLNTIWHGFSTNNSFNYRYSFVFSFFLLLTAQYIFDHRELISRKAVLLSGGLLAAVFLLAILQRRGFSHAAGSVMSIAVLAAGIWLLYANPRKPIHLMIVFSAVFLELGLNAALSWQELASYPEMVNHQEYIQFVQQTRSALEEVESRDSGFYRLEKTYHRTINDASFFSYNGLSHFSSTEPVFAKQFMRKMGFSTEKDFWAWYGEGSTAEVDSLLGVKYLLSQEDLSGKKDYPLLAQANGIRIYHNENALPVAMLCSGNIAEASMDTDDVYALHNSIWQGLTGTDSQVLLEADYLFSAENLQSYPSEDGHTVFEKVDPSQPASLRFEVPITRALPLSMYCTAPDFQKADLYIDGDFSGIYFDMNRWNMVCAGTYTPGDTVVVELRLQEESLRLEDAFFYYEDIPALTQMAQVIQSQSPELKQLSSSRFEGTFHAAENQMLLFTIPFSNGWKLSIDGKTVSCEKVLNTFLAVPVSPGMHSFSIHYLPVGLDAGCVLSLISLCGTCIWWFLKKKQDSP